MRRLIIKWVLMAVAFIPAAYLCDAMRMPVMFSDPWELAGLFKLLFGLALLSFLNATLGKLLKFLMLPLNCLTFGLVGLVINAGMLMIASNLSAGFTVNGFLTAFVCSLLYSGIGAILQSFLPDEKPKEEKE